MVDLDEVMNTLIEISREKEKILEKIYNLTIKQKEVIEQEKIESLNELIDIKQTEINDVQQLDVKFETIVGDLKIVYEIKSLDQLDAGTDKTIQLKQAVRNVMEKVKKIHQLEVENMESIKQLKSGLEKKIKHANQGRRAMRNYINVDDVQKPVFFDKIK